MKTKVLELIKEYFTNVIENKPICPDDKKRQAHDFITILKNEIVKKNRCKTIASTVADCMNLLNAMDRIRELEKENENIRNAKAEYIKDLEDKVYGGNYKCGSLKEQLPYPCNVLKAVTDCAQIAQEIKEMAKEKKKEYNPLDVKYISIYDNNVLFEGNPFTGQVDYKDGKAIQINKRTITI